ncbi:hypothetical protein TUM12370_37850 [Salmonella enterica subsp. enterica serovar Choleraesuis]|nr:hypothetical protein TUM12370_37850 [Salmonella enterica subsp. enterica serovar Choleraesuis]
MRPIVQRGCTNNVSLHQKSAAQQAAALNWCVFRYRTPFLLRESDHKGSLQRLFAKVSCDPV